MVEFAKIACIDYPAAASLQVLMFKAKSVSPACRCARDSDRAVTRVVKQNDAFRLAHRFKRTPVQIDRSASVYRYVDPLAVVYDRAVLELFPLSFHDLCLPGGQLRTPKISPAIRKISPLSERSFIVSEMGHNAIADTPKI